MSYINAEKVLPDWLIEEIRNRIGDGLVYIPPDKTVKRAWGSRSGIKQLLEERNQEIRQKRKDGVSIKHLALEFCLSEDTIKKILYKS